MNDSRPVGSAAVVCAAAALLIGGCGAGGSQLSTPSRVQPTTPMNARVNAFTGENGAMQSRFALHADRGRSSMAPDAAKNDLLYVSDDETNDVTVYSYPNGTLVGTLRGFAEPQGECTDGKGDVWIANTESSEIIEYAHGGTTPIAFLNDPGYYPASCSVDRTTGTIAVTNVVGTSGSQGNVAIYSGGRGTPAYLTSPNIYRAYFCDYDNKGNLYVDGQSTPSSGFGFAKLPRNATTFTSITLDRGIGFPGGVQWNGGHVLLGDQDASTIYQLKIAHARATITGTTSLLGASDVIQFWKQATTVVGPDMRSAFVGFWIYAASGSPTKTITDGIYAPVGAVVSRSVQ